jgi:serine/threonine-protein kinase
MNSENGASGARDPLDNGLAAAFGERGSVTHSHPSVLRTLQERTQSKLGVHLESQGLEDAPVRITDEVKALRDPSGRYQVLGEIGRGGMGIVYKGRDQDLGRDVAMKVLKDEYAKRPDVLARFVEEAQIGGQLQHPGIVPVYELGLQSGERPYFAMKLVKGETLAAQLAKRTSPADERRRLLGIFEQVCQTIAYAHARHVVHRDLKPANVMIGAFGEVQVVDWGFAKVLQKGGVADEAAAAKHEGQRSVIETARSRADSGSHSVAGSMMGTPAYMPPEQALGDIARVDERSDVFALGAILCELLTGDAPYREQDGDLVRQAAKAELDGAHERLAKCGADEALVALCKECLAPSQRARPASAGEVAQRVSAYLTSVEERARQAGVRAAEARLKHRVTLMSAGVGLVVLVLGIGAWLWIEGQARERRNDAAQRVASAMNTASAARGRAQSSKLDAGLWSIALSSAEQLVSLSESEDVEATSRGVAEELLAAVRNESTAAQAESDRLERDKTMLTQLELARIPADDDMRPRATEELRRLDQAYGKSFAAYSGGGSLLEQTRKDALESLRRGDIEVELAASLDHWALVRDALRSQAEAPDAAATALLREIARDLDAGDEWRTQLRVLLPNAAVESARLLDLARRAEFTTLGAVGCRVLGQALWSAGEKEAAVDVLRRGQEVHPRDFDLCFQLAVHLELLDEPRWSEAVEIYRIAQAIRPEQSEVLHRCVCALENLHRDADAERLSRMLLARNPSNAHWLNHLGRALRELGRFEEAEACFRAVVELQPKVSAYLGDLAFVLEKLGHQEEAIASYRRALELDPRNVHAHNNLGIELRERGQLDEAIACFRKALELDPRYAAAHLNLGNALRDQGRIDESMACYLEARKLDPQAADIHNSLGQLLASQRRWGEAQDCFRTALEINARCAEAHLGLGVTVEQQGDAAAAMESFERALEFDPRLAGAHYSLGSLLMERDLERALAELRKAAELFEQDPKPSGRRWLEVCRTSIAQLEHPASAQAFNIRGLALSNQGDRTGARECFQRAVELDPRFAPARINLGTHLLETDPERGLAELRVAVELFEADPSPFGRHWLEESRGRLAQAEQQIAQRAPLGEVLEGRAAVSSDEWNAAVQYGYEQKRYREVLELTEATLRDAPELIGGMYGAYCPACVAALLAADVEAAGIGTQERAHLREQARAWLAREIERWIAQIEQGAPDAGDSHGMLIHVQGDPDLASVRGAAIDALPESEREAWRALWKRIEAGAAK